MEASVVKKQRTEVNSFGTEYMTGRMEEDDSMHVENHSDISGGIGQFSDRCCNIPMIEDLKPQESTSNRPTDANHFTVSATQTPFRCISQYAYF